MEGGVSKLALLQLQKTSGGSTLTRSIAVHYGGRSRAAKRASHPAELARSLSLTSSSQITKPRGQRTGELSLGISCTTSARRQAEDYARASPPSHGWPPFVLVCRCRPLHRGLCRFFRPGGGKRRKLGSKDLRLADGSKVSVRRASEAAGKRREALEGSRFPCGKLCNTRVLSIPLAYRQFLVHGSGFDEGSRRRDINCQEDGLVGPQTQPLIGFRVRRRTRTNFWAWN